MVWYEVYHNTSVNQWWIYKVTGNGQSYTLFKTFKTEQGARNFAKKHWVKRWA